MPNKPRLTLPPLTGADITRLLAAGGARKAARTTGPHYYVRTPEGLQRIAGHPPSELRGTFQGKAGSKRRSRKGRVWTLPNGTRTYGAEQPWNDTPPTVVAYYPGKPS